MSTATRTACASGASEAGLARELSRVANQHGISHWQGQAATWIAVGAGMREAGLSQAEMEGVLARLGGADNRERGLVAEGDRGAL